MAVNSLSVFFPSYNEAENLPATVSKAAEVLKTLGIKWEIIIVNDGSTDNTKEVAAELTKKYPQVKVVNQSNGGYGMALRAGFTNASYEWVVYTDADGQFDFSEIDKFLKEADSADVVWGYRIKRNDPFYRLLFAKGWALSLFFFFGLRLRDVDCGFKMLNRKVVDKISPLQSSRGGMINAEIAIKSKKAGFKIAQVGVNHYARQAGSPTGASLKVIIKSYLDLLSLWWRIH